MNIYDHEFDNILSIDGIEISVEFANPSIEDKPIYGLSLKKVLDGADFPSTVKGCYFDVYMSVCFIRNNVLHVNNELALEMVNLKDVPVQVMGSSAAFYDKPMQAFKSNCNAIGVLNKLGMDITPCEFEGSLLSAADGRFNQIKINPACKNFKADILLRGEKGSVFEAVISSLVK